MYSNSDAILNPYLIGFNIMGIALAWLFQNDLRNMLRSSESLKELVSTVVLNEHEEYLLKPPYILIDFKSGANVLTDIRKGYLMEFGIVVVKVDTTHRESFEASSIIQEMIEANNFPINKHYEVVGVKHTRAKLTRHAKDLIKLDIVYKAYLRAPMVTQTNKSINIVTKTEGDI